MTSICNYCLSYCLGWSWTMHSPFSSKDHLVRTFEWINLTSIKTPKSLPSLSCFDPIKSYSTTWTRWMWLRTPMTKRWRFLLVTTRSVKSLTSAIPSWHYILHIYEGFELCVYLDPISSRHQFHQRSGYSRNHRLGGRTVILPVSFYGSNLIDITRNCQVIQVFLSFLRSSIWRLPTRTTICSP